MPKPEDDEPTWILRLDKDGNEELGTIYFGRLEDELSPETHVVCTDKANVIIMASHDYKIFAASDALRTASCIMEVCDSEDAKKENKMTELMKKTVSFVKRHAWGTLDQVVIKLPYANGRALGLLCRLMHWGKPKPIDRFEFGELLELLVTAREFDCMRPVRAHYYEALKEIIEQPESKKPAGRFVRDVLEWNTPLNLFDSLYCAMFMVDEELVRKASMTLVLNIIFEEDLQAATHYFWSIYMPRDFIDHLTELLRAVESHLGPLAISLRDQRIMGEMMKLADKSAPDTDAEEGAAMRNALEKRFAMSLPLQGSIDSVWLDLETNQRSQLKRDTKKKGRRTLVDEWQDALDGLKHMGLNIHRYLMINAYWNTLPRPAGHFKLEEIDPDRPLHLIGWRFRAVDDDRRKETAEFMAQAQLDIQDSMKEQKRWLKKKMIRKAKAGEKETLTREQAMRLTSLI